MPNNSPSPESIFTCNAAGDRYLPEAYPETLASKAYDLIWRSSFAPIEYKQEQTYIFTGSDCGLLIKAFARTYDQTPLSLFFIEEKSVIELIRHECAPALEKMQFAELLTINEFKEATELQQYDTSLVAGRVSAIKSASVSKDNSGRYKAIDEQIHFLMNAQRWAVINTISRLPFLEQRLTNIPEMTVSASILANQLKDQTVVVLAAGPSLDDHIEWVKENRSKLVLISVSRISKRLLSEGIMPDIVTIIDPHAISFEVSREALEFQPAPILAFSDQGVAQIVSQWDGPKIYTGTRLPWKAEAFELRVNAPTVSNLAFALAAVGHPRQIILLGIDFCLDEAGHTHATGNMEREKGISLRTDMEEVHTYDGSVRLSSIDYYKSGKFLEQQILESTKNINVINPSPGAMKLQGVKHIPLAEVRIDAPETEKCISTLRAEIDTQQKNSHWLSESGRLLQQFVAKLGEFRRLALDGKKTVTAAKVSRANYQKCLSKLNKIDHRIKHKFLEQRTFCISNTGHLFAEILNTGAESELHESSDSLDKSEKIYKAYLHSTKSLTGMLKNAQSLLRLRKTESDKIWSQELVDQLLELNLPRKILHTSAELPAGSRAAAEVMQVKQRNRKTERLQAVLNTMEVSGSSLFTALNGAYTQQSIDKLNHFRNVISQMEDFRQHAIYALLAEAYLAEIIGDTHKAMDCYQAIIDDGETPLLEEALNRVAFLCIRIGDSDTAMLALTALSEINPMYQATLEHFQKVA